MNPARVRRALHAVHASSSVLLVGTGALIHWPELRSYVLGGYGMSLAALHEWTGLAFIVAPLLSLGLSAGPLVRDLGARLGPPDPPNWRKLHIVLTLALSALLSASGVAIWQQEHLPNTAADLALDVHVFTSWAIALSIPIHLFAARRKIADIVAMWLGLRAAPELEQFADDD